MIHESNDDIRENLINTLRNLRDARDLGVDSLEKLNDQDNKIYNVCNNSNKLNKNLDESEHKIKEMENPWITPHRSKATESLSMESKEFVLEGKFMKYMSRLRIWYSTNYKLSEDELCYGKRFSHNGMKVNMLNTVTNVKNRNQIFHNGHVCRYDNVIEIQETHTLKNGNGKIVIHIFKFDEKGDFDRFISFLRNFSSIDQRKINTKSASSDNPSNKSIKYGCNINDDPFVIEVCELLDELSIISSHINHKASSQIKNMNKLSEGMEKASDRMIKDGQRMKKL